MSYIAFWRQWRNFPKVWFVRFTQYIYKNTYAIYLKKGTYFCIYLLVVNTAPPDYLAKVQNLNAVFSAIFKIPQKDDFYNMT